MKNTSTTQIKNRQQRAVILLYYSDLFSNSQQRDLYWLGIGGWVRGVCLLLIFSGTPCGQMITSLANQSWRKKWSLAWPFNVSLLYSLWWITGLKLKYIQQKQLVLPQWLIYQVTSSLLYNAGLSQFSM